MITGHFLEKVINGPAHHTLHHILAWLEEEFSGEHKGGNQVGDEVVKQDAETEGEGEMRIVSAEAGNGLDGAIEVGGKEWKWFGILCTSVGWIGSLRV